MGYKDTVMGSEQWQKIYTAWLKYPGGTAGDLSNRMNEAQAKKTWTIAEKEGMRKVVRWLKEEQGIYYIEELYFDIEKQVKVWGL